MIQERIVIIVIVLSLSRIPSAFGQDKTHLNSFSPLSSISYDILSKRLTKEHLTFLESCNWRDKVGKRIDVFWLKTQSGSLFGHVYEYFLDCDNVRLIYWSPNPSKPEPLYDFMIEDLESDSKYVSGKNKYLRTKNRYKKYLK